MLNTEKQKTAAITAMSSANVCLPHGRVALQVILIEEVGRQSLGLALLGASDDWTAGGSQGPRQSPTSWFGGAHGLATQANIVLTRLYSTNGLDITRFIE